MTDLEALLAIIMVGLFVAAVCLPDYPDDHWRF